MWWIPRADQLNLDISFVSKHVIFLYVEMLLNFAGRIAMVALLLNIFYQPVKSGKLLGIITLSIFSSFIVVYAFLEFNTRYQYQLVAWMILLCSIGLENKNSDYLKVMNQRSL